VSFLTGLLARPRVVIATALLLAIAGLFSWATMPREEDPQFPHRDGLVVVHFPGADAETVERLVVEPLEEHLAEVAQINDVFSTARVGAAILHVEMNERVYDTELAWDEVEEALAEAELEFPAGASSPALDDDLVSQEAVVLAVTGAADPLRLAGAAEELKREILALPSVKQVNVVADPGEQITVEYDDAVARRLGIDPRLLGMQLGGRSAILPGGVIHLGAKTANLRPRTDFRSVAEIESTPILLPSGSTVPLGEVARVRRGPEEPASERMRFQGEPAVGLGVVPKDDLDRIAFGREVRQLLDRLRPGLEPLRVQEVVFQPDHVDTRLRDLTRSLRYGIVIVAVVLFVAMGWRMGLLVALVVPLVALGSIALYAAGGGILHQISIAALVIALGMLVDNAIVMVENIQWRLDRGVPAASAAQRSVRELALPLGTATGTTLAAFIPMLVSKGNTADFTRALPILIMLTLTVSYLFAVMVTPVLAGYFLRRREAGAGGRSARLADAVARVGVGHPGWVLAGAALLLAATVVAAGWVERQFFPTSDRTTVIVELEMPEGTHLDRTDEAALEVERALLERPEVTSVATFVGRAAPKFYYNLLAKPESPHRAQLVAETESLEAVEGVIEWTRDFVHRRLPSAEVVARRLEQGPPIAAPIEVRVLGRDLQEMEAVADRLLAELRAIPGTRDVRHDLGLGAPTVAFHVDDAAAARHGLSRGDVAAVLLGRTLGTEVGQYRMGDDPVPILVRSSAGEELPAAELESIDVMTPGGEPVPLGQLARLEVEWRPAAIHHRDRTREVKVQAQLAEGVTSTEVLDQLAPRLERIEVPDGLRLELGGEMEESGKANSAILGAMPLGVLLLLFFLLAEFNSFRRVGIVLVTVPLAATGVVPGLLLSGQPFGFMSMLGVISLVGIVVNNAIVLLDVVETLRSDGLDRDEALREAVRRRTRPILLTMATTVAGLSPLAFSEANLWPPLAWAMISGLIASTVLTLLVIPALYRVLFSPRWRQLRQRVTGRRAAAGAAAVLALAVLARPANAGEPPSLTLSEAMARAAEHPRARAAALQAEAASSRATAEKRRALFPTVGASAEVVRRDRDFDFTTPIGEFTLGERTSDAVGVEVAQPLLDPATLFYRAPAARSEAAAAAQRAVRARQLLAADAARTFLEVVAIDGRIAATEAFIHSLGARLDETEERVEAGRTLRADALKLRLELESAELDRTRLRERRKVATRELGRAVGVEGPVEPSLPGGEDPGDLLDQNLPEGSPPTAAELTEKALATRPDLRAVEEQLLALELQRGAVKAERLPVLTATASWSRANGDPFRPEEIVQGTVGVTWNPFAAGTRAPRLAALEADRRALEADLEDLRRGVELEIRDALAAVEVAEEAAEVRRRGVELATETLRVERERHGAGRSTTNDLLDAEAELRRQRTDRELARLEILAAWVRLELASGVGLVGPSPWAGADGGPGEGGQGGEGSGQRSPGACAPG